jgi:hypothetical protein
MAINPLAMPAREIGGCVETQLCFAAPGSLVLCLGAAKKLAPPGGALRPGWSQLGGGHSGDAFWRDLRGKRPRRWCTNRAYWGCFRSSFASLGTPAGCLLQLIHGLDEGARGAKSGCKKSRGFSIQATLYPDSFRSGLKERDQSTIDRVDYRHRLPVGFPVSTMPPPDCTCVAGHASNFLRPTL